MAYKWLRRAAFFLPPKYFLFLLFLVAGCATDFDENIESARFALDQGQFDTAISKAQDALDEDSTNIEARYLLGLAYVGKSGIDLIAVAEVLLRLEETNLTNFQAVASEIPQDGDLTNLRTGINILDGLNLTGITTISDDTRARYVFDLGLLKALEHIAIGVYASDYFGDNYDPAQITEAQYETVLDNLLTFDDDVVATGVSSNESFVRETRQTFCVLEPITAGAGFTIQEYRAFVACQLADDPSIVDTTEYTADIANCGDLDPDEQENSVLTCYRQNTALD